MASPLSLNLLPVGSMPHIGHGTTVPSRVVLTDQEFLTQGGEARIYVKDGLAFKIYHEPANAIPQRKIEELATIAHPTVVRPLGLLETTKRQAVGSFMLHLQHTLPLARLFTNTFREDHHVTPARVAELVEQLRACVAAVHTGHCLVVDLNEFNYLVDERFKLVYAIDTTAYQTPHFPATVILPTVRDYQAQTFTVLSDWYSFAILACQLFVGLHPYKGHHPKYASASCIERMQQGASIFDPGVKLPPPTRPFTLIPDHYRQWMLALFQQRKRLPPPDGTPVTVTTPLISSPAHGLFQTARLGQVDITILDERIHLDGKPTTFLATHLFGLDGALYTLYKDHFSELRLHRFGVKQLLSVAKTWNVLPHATAMLDGLLFQNVLGMPYLLVPLAAGDCRIFPVPELAGYTILEGRRKDHLIEIVAAIKGRYDRIQLTVPATGTAYIKPLAIEADITYQ